MAVRIWCCVRRSAFGVRHRQHSLEVGFIRLTGRCDGPAASSVPATEHMGPRTGPGPTGAVFMLLPVLILSLQSPLEANFPERLDCRPPEVAQSGSNSVFAVAVGGKFSWIADHLRWPKVGLRPHLCIRSTSSLPFCAAETRCVTTWQPTLARPEYVE